MKNKNKNSQSLYQNVVNVVGSNIEVKKEFSLEELHIYGSSRHGIHKPSVTLVNKTYKLNNIDSATDSTQAFLSYKYFKRTLTYKQYELTNHLGNVLATVLDRKTFVGDDTLEYYQADVYTAGLYYAFGSAITEMQYSSDTGSRYRYGFNGMEKDNESFTDAYDFGARIYDGRLGRWLSLDPLMKIYPSLSAYCGMGNSPILFKDIEGKYIYVSTNFESSLYYPILLNILNLKNDKGADYINQRKSSSEYHVTLLYHTNILAGQQGGVPTGNLENDQVIKFYANKTYTEKDGKNNGEVFVSHISEIGKALAIFHEFLHTRIVDGSNLNHDQIYDNYLDELKLSVKLYATTYKIDLVKIVKDKYNITATIDECVEALALMGLEESKNYIEKYGTDESRTKEQQIAYDRLSRIQFALAWEKPVTVELNGEGEGTLSNEKKKVEPKNDYKDDKEAEAKTATKL